MLLDSPDEPLPLADLPFALGTDRHTTLSSSRIGDLVRAALVLMRFERHRIS
ncbi:hypothetical protein [Microbispora sp. NPDC046933]|uniref:hypothetical protein n=1 Tax=Microbispora sp. NPDC046933 TaxID=3155618 RepID=UPI0033F7AF28